MNARLTFSPGLTDTLNTVQARGRRDIIVLAFPRFPRMGLLEMSIGTADLVDVDGFRAMMRDAGAEEAVNDILATFVTDAPGRWAALANAISSGTANDIRQTAHAYKSSACAIRAHALAMVLLRIELGAYEGRVSEAHALADDAHRESDAAVAQLIQYLSVALSDA